MSRVAIMGDGAWGTALAFVAKQAGHEVITWSRKSPTDIADAEAVIAAIPSQSMRDALLQVVIGQVPVIIAAKGIERGTGLLMADVVREVHSTAIPLTLSGPSFAADVMKGLPTAVTLAADDITLATHWAKALSLPTFRIYQSDDLKGVELGGALKNVLAIASGISDGLGFGDSARAALITRGFAELRRLATKLGAREQTLMGLSGLGDLLLTASSPQSRNRSFGFAIGSGTNVATALAQSKGVVEGAATAAMAQKLGLEHKITTPIVDAVCRIVDGGDDPRHVVRDLLARPAHME